jgi:hypothetical protein
LRCRTALSRAQCSGPASTPICTVRNAHVLNVSRVLSPHRARCAKAASSLQEHACWENEQRLYRSVRHGAPRNGPHIHAPRIARTCCVFVQYLLLRIPSGLVPRGRLTIAQRTLAAGMSTLGYLERLQTVGNICQRTNWTPRSSQILLFLRFCPRMRYVRSGKLYSPGTPARSNRALERQRWRYGQIGMVITFESLRFGSAMSESLRPWVSSPSSSRCSLFDFSASSFA